MNLLRLSIRQTYANIGMESRQGQFQMKSPQGELNVETTPAAMEVQRVPAELTIDSSKAWMALGKGNHLEWLQMVSSQMEQQFLMNVSRIVDEGNRLAQFTKPGNSIADIMAQRVQEKPSIEYNGTASNDNVRVQYTPVDLQMSWSLHQTNVNYSPQRPEVAYTPGGVDVYIRNQNSLKIWVSDYDLYG
ncbi:hypothetical protein J28TS4_53570 [Paenibacillus lautus]|uniref:DUF6470 family protein n=1 Tax=Paenibacillus lautus TaxID=1401 RepID=UPI001B0CE148|nr:DUF6470 family protein [Paenibacillus lautus]MEC0258336.1 DUF6470 family protein [Paenibacillus lautus]GIP06950.1 hypothetical protein J28TS4_53570 [Paenibacillus lautus]